MKVKRWHSDSSDHRPDKDGAWVTFEDFQTVLTERDAFRTALTEMEDRFGQRAMGFIDQIAIDRARAILSKTK